MSARFSVQTLTRSLMFGPGRVCDAFLNRQEGLRILSNVGCVRLWVYSTTLTKVIEDEGVKTFKARVVQSPIFVEVIQHVEPCV